MIENELSTVVRQKFVGKPAETPGLMPLLEGAIEAHRRAARAAEQARLAETTALIWVNELQRAIDRAWEEYQLRAWPPESVWHQR